MSTKCTKNKKVRYPTEDEANERLNRIKRKSPRHGNKMPVRSYECEFCGGWHFTSRDEHFIVYKKIILTEQFKKFIQ